MSRSDGRAEAFLAIITDDRAQWNLGYAVFGFPRFGRRQAS
jgi:hypothetical protein